MGSSGMPWKECGLQEALIYYDRYYKDAYKTNNIKWFNYSLYRFIGGKNLNKIPNLRLYKYKIITETRNNVYKLKFTENFNDEPTRLSEYQIITLEKFYNHFMKGNTLKETKLNAITLKIAYTAIILTIIIVMFVTQYHNSI